MNLIDRNIKHIPMPFIVGSPRSGTTLLRLMLDAHPALAIPPETGFLCAAKHIKWTEPVSREQFLEMITSYPPNAPAWNDFHISVEVFRSQLEKIQPFDLQEGFRLFYKMYASRFGKPRWGDKTPMYCRYLLDVREALPEAHFIHIIRDGRDAMTSLRKQWFSPGSSIATQSAYWRDNVMTARTQGHLCPHYLEIYYEELVRNPEKLLRQICKFIELDFDPNMLKYYQYAPGRLQEHLERRQMDGSLLVSQATRYNQQINTTLPLDVSKIGVWRNLLRADEIRQFEKIAGNTLQSFGYKLYF